MKTTFQEARNVQQIAIRNGWKSKSNADPVRDPKTGGFKMQFRFSLEQKREQ